MVRAFAVASLVTVACATSAAAAPRPAKPHVLGPRRTADRTPTFRFTSGERGVPARALRFRCSLDARRFRRCGRRYTPRLRLGRHVLRVIAVDPGGRRSSATRVVVRIIAAPPAPARPDQTIPVGHAPYNVVFGFGSLWVPIDNTVVRVDPASGAVQARIDVGGRPWGVVVADGAVWEGNLDNQSIAEIDPATNTVVRQFRLPGSPVGVAVGAGALWAANNDNDDVWRIDPASGAFTTTHLGDRHEFIGFSEGRVWVASEDGTIGQLDPLTGAVVRTLRAGSDADYLGFSPGAVWVTNYASPYLWRIDAATGTIVKRLNIRAPGAQGVQDDGTSLWVALYNRGLVLQLDRNTGAVRKRFQVGKKPRGLTIAAGSVWVANSESGTISRIALGR